MYTEHSEVWTGTKPNIILLAYQEAVMVILDVNKNYFIEIENFGSLVLFQILYMLKGQSCML